MDNECVCVGCDEERVVECYIRIAVIQVVFL